MDNQWQEPVRLTDGGLQITIATPAQARTWLQHAQRRAGWEEALDKCSGAAEGRVSNAEARRAFLKAAN